jgi:putative endonuclease
MYFVYIIYSATKDKYYVGECADVDERLRRHNTNHKGFTGGTGDWKLVYCEIFDQKEKALAREKQIKSWKSRKVIEKLISG